ncbi:Signal peptidase complex subunit [Gurleya vavrai]
MHKTIPRFQAICSVTFNATVVLLHILAITTFLTQPSLPKCSLEIVDFVNGERSAKVKFKPNIDLSSQFNPFLKQVFVYLKIVYGNDNEEIVWSKIVKRSDLKKLHYTVENTYSFRFPMLKDNIYFELRGNHFPFVGSIQDKLYAKYVVGDKFFNK